MEFPRYREHTGFYCDTDIKEKLLMRAGQLGIAFTRLVERYCMEGLIRDELAAVTESYEKRCPECPKRS